jgi:hypothetical protein
MSSAKGIFICYRRDDAEGYAGRIYDRLHARFPGRVFMDVTGISPGADFSRVIQDTVGSCHVLLAIIGKQWLTITDSSTKPRIQRDDDYVRHEIATALYRNIAVIPVLVRDAKMPGQESLTPDLASLSTRNALQVSDDDFEHDALRLISAIEYVMGETRVAPPPPPRTGNRTCLIVAIIASVLLVGGFVIALVFGAALWGGGGGGGGGGGSDVPYSRPTATATQQPEPSETSANEVFNPVGNWTMQVSGNGASQEIPLTIHSDHTYEYPNGVGDWTYSDGTLTFVSTEGRTTFTVEGHYGDGYTGHAIVYGVSYQAVLVPR